MFLSPYSLFKSDDKALVLVCVSRGEEHHGEECRVLPRGGLHGRTGLSVPPGLTWVTGESPQPL